MEKDNLTPEKLDLESLDIVDDNKSKLKQLFPSVFKETVDEDGKTIESIDFEKLKAEVGEFSDIYEGRKERYGMDWPGKKDCIKLIQQPSRATLKPCREESVDFDTTENIFIEGENLEVLKLLQKSYYGKIKMIYIDPPYNIGTDRIYKDDFKDSLKNYFELTGQIDNEGRQLSANTESTGRYHTNWLNMMYPRLYLARNLLREDGVMFISIDDIELDKLKNACNELFGESNVVGIISRVTKRGGNAGKFFSPSLDYVVVCTKNSLICSPFRLNASRELISTYNKEDDIGRYKWRNWYDPSLTLERSRNARYFITAPDGVKIWPPESKRWRNVETTFKEKLSKGEIKFEKKESPLVNEQGNLAGWAVYYKLRSDKALSFGVVPDNIIDDSINSLGTQTLSELSIPFDFPKPVELIQKLAELVKTEDSIILDFFAGSGTTADSVSRSNNIDGGSRKYILVQLPEKLDPLKNEQKIAAEFCKSEGLPLNVAELTKERIRRVIRKIKNEENETTSNLFNNHKQDLGFKVFKLDYSTFKIWEKPDADKPEKDLKKQIELQIEHINDKASEEDILYEILLKSGFMLTEKIETIKLAGKKVYDINNNSLLICLEDEITKELIDAVAEREPLQFLCLDRGFHGNDQLKANALQTFKALNQTKEKEVQIVFKTI